MTPDEILLKNNYNKITEDDCYAVYRNDKNKVYIEIHKKTLTLKIYKETPLNRVVLGNREVYRAINKKVNEIGREQEQLKAQEQTLF